jgi:ribosomal protein S24E
MAGYGKGKATGYTDYYNGKDKALEDVEDRGKLKGIGLAKETKTDEAGDRLRKEALKRRLARKKKAGM